MTNILLCLSHAIEEYDQLRLLHSLGYGVFSIGGYIDPAHPHDPKRPALPEVPHHADLHAAVDQVGDGDHLGNAQAQIPDVVLDWLGDDGVIIYHHNLHRLFGQWDRVSTWRELSSGRRLIWRTVGQSVEHNEREAAPYRDQGLEIVRYSPKERAIPGYVGEDALIRFYKDPGEWDGWIGDDPVVIQFVQNFAARWQWCNRLFFEQATNGLHRAVHGPQSEDLEYGLGEATPAEQLETLRRSRVYLYTGTQPASYTLGLIEAMMTGIPVVSISPRYMTIFPYGPELFEGHEIAGLYGEPDDGEPEKTDAQVVDTTRGLLLDILRNDHLAEWLGAEARRKAVELFGRDVIAAQWKAFLG